MRPILFEIGQFKFYSFGSFIALGAIVAGLFLVWAAKRRRLHTHHLFDTVLYTLLFGLLGGRLTYYFLYQNQFKNILQVLYFWQGGLVALGGLVAGFLAYLYYIRQERDPMWQMLDIGILGLLLGWTFGKFGCHLSTCTLGRTADNLFSLNGSYPVDLFSLIWAGAIFIVMTLLWLKNKLSDGVVFFLGLEALFLGELLIKTLRADFSDGLARTEALIMLGLIVAIYLIFWRLHGPRFEKNRFGTMVRNLVFRRKPKE